MKVNMKTISQITGFSQATVSNVLNHKKGTNPETAKEILRIAEEIGYLSSSKINNIKLVFFKKSGQVLTETPLITELIDGITSKAQQNNLSTILLNIQKDDIDYKEKFHSLFSERNSGIILLATELSPEDMSAFQKLSCPFVVVDAWFEEYCFDTVLMNNYDSFITAANYLIENGHTNIGFLGSQIQIQNFYSRERGFCDALVRHGLPVNKEHFIYLAPTINGAYESMKNYLDTSSEQLPTAFCAVNDIIALGAMKAFQEYGYHIPDDISIIGFDNMPFGEISFPALTTIDVPKKAIGELAVERLLKQCSSSHVPCKTELLTKTVIRKSVRNLK